MNYIQFLYMIPEAILVVILIFTFVMDFCLGYDLKKKALGGDPFNTGISALMLVLAIVCFVTIPKNGDVQAFGGMYVATQAAAVMKTILAAGTFIVCIQARQWLSRPDTSFKAGEFYMLVESTLLGMFMMMSSGHFLMFFLGQWHPFPWPASWVSTSTVTTAPRLPRSSFSRLPSRAV